MAKEPRTNLSGKEARKDNILFIYKVVALFRREQI